MKVERIRLAELTPDPDNAKDHPAWQVEQIKASIEQFGNLDPIGVWGPQNLIVEGHGRYEALKELGYQEAEVIRLDQLTDEERRAYALAHNQTTLTSGFDPDLLKLNLDSIKGIDMTLFGFGEMENLEEIDVVEDEIPEEPETRAKAGDLWQLGNHRLYCGDSTEAESLERLMGGVQADMLLTDPPYNVAYGQKKDVAATIARHRRKDGLVIENDNMEETRFYAFLLQAFKTVLDNMRAGASFYIWHADTHGLTVRQALEDAGATLRQNLIWAKTSFTFGLADYQWKHEPCLYGWKDGQAHYFAPTRKESTVIEDWVNPNKMTKAELIDFVQKMQEAKEIPSTVIYEPKPITADLHPTMKPIKLMARLIRNSSKPGEAVLDPFGGSGSTLIACEQLNRRCYTCELDPHYADVIIERWERLTGKKAVLIDG